MAGLRAVALCAFAACERHPARDRIIVLGLDGVDPDAVDRLVAEGQLPNLAARHAGAPGVRFGVGFRRRGW